MNEFPLIKGIILGFSIAAPVGPIGILCIRRTLNLGMISGFLSGLGAATADAIYGAIAAFGVTVVTNFLIRQEVYIHALGSLFLFYLGCKTLIAPPSTDSKISKPASTFGSYASTFLLTITNPMTILAFSAIFAGLGAGAAKGDDWTTTLLVTGVFCGSLLWWFVLSGTVTFFRKKFTLTWLKWINRTSGALIIGFAIFNFGEILWR